jgi:hypothetical protein
MEKKQSKLYTEEEVRKLLNEMLLLSSSVDDAINSLTPIELPTDEEIEKVAEKKLSVNFLSFIEGAKWMRDKIKGGQDESNH